MTCTACGKQPKNTAKDFTKAVIEIDNPETLILFRKVVIPTSMGDETNVPAAVGKYYNVLLVYEVNNHAYLYSSDGIPTLLTSDIAQEIEEKIDTVANNLATETLNRQNADTTLGNNINTVSGDLATEITNRQDADSALQGNINNEITARENADIALDSRLDTVEGLVATAVQPADINRVVTADLALDSNISTSTVQLNESKVNLSTGTTSSENIVLPVASTTQAGVMNSSTYDALTTNTNNLNAIMNGAVAITGLSANPSQSDLTTAWLAQTNLPALINRASIYDVDNDKVWTYYMNDALWHAASNTSQVTINTFTNSSEGTILGSTNTGQVFAENDGTGSVNGWDALNNSVSTNTGNITSLQTAVAGKQDTLTAGSNINITGNTISATVPTVNDATLTIQNNGATVGTFTANSATNTTANIVSPVDIGSVLSTPSDVAYVNSNNITNNAVTTSKIADGAVTADKLDFSTLGFGNYSTTEQDTGFTWIDGKAIYKKTIEWGAMPNNARVDRANLFPNNANVIRIDSVIVQGPGTGPTMGVHNMPYTSPSGGVDTVFVSDKLTGQVSVYTDADRSNWDAYITLYYTKTS